MLSSEYRFHGLGSLSFVYRRGQTVRGSQLALKYSLNSRRTIFRVAVVVSRKVHKSAVVRNRIRRRIYEVLQTKAAAIKAPYDLVFTVYNSNLADMDTRELQQLVVGQLNRAGVL